MSIAGFGVRKPVIANLVMLAIIGAGIIFGVSLRREFFPEVRPTEVLISAPYPGASPDEVEDSLAIKIEDQVADLEDVEEINTTIGEGFATVRVEFSEGVDVTEKVFDVKREMDALQDLPQEVERITVDKFEPNLPVINVSLYGSDDERDMKTAINAIRDDLRSLPDMGTIAVSGVRTDEITVEVDPASTLEHGLSLPAIAARVSEAMIELPGGAVRAPTINTAVRTVGADEVLEDVRRIVVKAGGQGQVLRLEDVARVTSGFEDVDLRSRLNTEPAVSLTVFKVGDEDAVDMAAAVKAYVAGREGEYIELTATERARAFFSRASFETPGKLADVSPRLAAWALGLERSGVPLPGTLVTTTDLARFIVGRLDLLTRNALMGGVLVLLTLVLLLNWRVAFWVAIGLLVSLLGTLATMHFIGSSLNLLTMFGLIIVLGLLVDDAIVVAENITARHEKGEPALDAAVKGTGQVGWPVVATVVTTICAFMPLTLIEGTTGDLMGALPVVVASALLVSLIECLYILPSHMGHALISADKAARRPRANPLERLDRRVASLREGFFNRVLTPHYLKVLGLALKAPVLTVTIAVAVVVISFGMVAGKRVPFTFLGSNDAETLNVSLQMPVGTTTEETDAIVRRIEAATIAQPEVSAAFATVGSSGALDGSSSTSSPHLAQLIVELVPVEARERGSDEVIVAIREQLGELPGVKSLSMEEVSGGPEGPAITYTIVGDRLPQMTPVVELIKDRLETYDGVYNISDDNDAGRRELRIELLEGAQELGFTVEGIARQVRATVFGLEAHTFPGEREDVDVRVQAPESVRRSPAAIESMYVFTPMGEPVPLGEVASITEAEGYATVKRLDRRRAITVTAEVDRAIANPEDITREVEPELREAVASIAGVDLIVRGRQQDVAESFATLPLGMLVAAGLIYVILAALFSSYLQPLFVLTAVPFATIGMIWGHFLLGFDMTILSLIGFIALAGVVVNDSLIFMEFFNHARSEGMSVRDACKAAGRARIRAILLTTVTTVLGLLPLMLEQSLQARFLIPMAITIAFGLMSATVIILVVLPCLLVIGDAVKRRLTWAWRGGVPADDNTADRTPGAVQPV